MPVGFGEKALFVRSLRILTVFSLLLKQHDGHKKLWSFVFVLTESKTSEEASRDTESQGDK